MPARRHPRALILAAALIGAGLAPPGASAEGLTSQATLSAMAFQPINRGAPIAVRLYDDSQEGIALKQAFEQQLIPPDLKNDFFDPGLET